MRTFGIDLETIVFVLAVMNLVGPLFVVVHGHLTGTRLLLRYFILAKALQGLSWVLRLVWFSNGDPLLSGVSDVTLLMGFAVESILLVEFARPKDRPGRHRFAASFGVLALLAVGAGLFSTALRDLMVFAGFLGFLAYAAWSLYFAQGAGRFQKLMACLYAFLPPFQAVFYALNRAEVAVPGVAHSVGSLVYYVLLVLLQVVGSLGYLLMVKERDLAVLRDQATHDVLTGIYNRRAFYEVAGGLAAAAVRKSGPISVILADLDRFKQVNDLQGHQAGDRLLLTFCQAVQESIRQGDVFARNGGDEFVLLLPDAGMETAVGAEERIRQRHSELVGTITDGQPACTVSLGVCSGVPRSPDDLTRFLATADEALYRAKDGGRNRVETAELSPEIS